MQALGHQVFLDGAMNEIEVLRTFDMWTNFVSIVRDAIKGVGNAFVEILSYILSRGPRYLRTHKNQWYAGCLQVVKSDAESELRNWLGARGVSARAPSGQWSPLAAPSTPEEGQATRTSTHDGYQPPAAWENLADRDTEVLWALSQVPRHRENRVQLPRNVFAAIPEPLRCDI